MAGMTPKAEVRPQAGSQERFLSTSADIAIYGGAAGAGKSYALLMEPLRHVGNKDFSAVIFRRTYPQISNPGGLWDTSVSLYPRCGATPKQASSEWAFPSGAKVKFAHMQYEKDKNDWDGSQVPLIAFDQLEHFTRTQFFYMLSRNRSTCGVTPYIRATCNPVPEDDVPGGWLHTLLQWWIDEETGLPIRERAGVVRWFVVQNDEVIWSDTRNDTSTATAKSCTFIPGTLDDNQILKVIDPGYEANLDALPKVFRERLKFGNWNARASAGNFFKREWFEIVDASPVLVDSIRYWDRAATENNEGGSWTAGVLMGRDERGVFYVTDVSRFQGSALTVRSSIKNTATQDGTVVRIGIEQDPGQAGKAEAEDHIRNLAGFDARTNAVRESKGQRASMLSAQAEAGNMKLVRGRWNDTFLREAENFDGSGKCMADQVDAASGAFHMLTSHVQPRVTWI